MKCVYKKLVPIVGILAMLPTQLSWAAKTFLSDTIPTGNRTPIVQLFSLSRPDFLSPSAPKTIQFENRLDIANYLSAANKAGEIFFIDGETWTLNNTIVFSLDEQSYFKASLPLVRHDKGFTDRFIYHFHDILQLPQNGRSNSNQNRIDWVLGKDGKQVLRVTETKSGIGDINLTYSWKPQSIDTSQVNLQLKLPTGEFEKQTGSNKPDIGLSFVVMNPNWFKKRDYFENHALALWYGLGINYIGHVGKLEPFDPIPWVATLRAGVGVVA